MPPAAADVIAGIAAASEVEHVAATFVAMRRGHVAHGVIFNEFGDLGNRRARPGHPRDTRVGEDRGTDVAPGQNPFGTRPDVRGGAARRRLRAGERAPAARLLLAATGQRAGHQPVQRGQVHPEAGLQGLPRPEVFRRRGDRPRRQRRQPAGRVGRGRRQRRRVRRQPVAAQVRGRGSRPADRPAGDARRHGRAGWPAQAAPARCASSAWARTTSARAIIAQRLSLHGHPRRAQLRYRADDRQRLRRRCSALCCSCSPTPATTGFPRRGARCWWSVSRRSPTRSS
ncbi:hypothetical protein RLIN73S_01390 [Rhodanobacter lindaniclasticus]